MSLKNQTVLVVGGSTGIGFAIAQEAASEGARVIILSRDETKLKKAQSQLGGETLIAAADFRSLEQLNQALAPLPTIDHLVLTASVDVAWGPFQGLTAERLVNAFQGKFIGYVQSVQAALPKLSRQGSITFITGAASRIGVPNTSGLAAVNGAISQMAQTLSKELAPIRVNVVSPGLTDTPAYDSMPAAQRQELFRASGAKLPVGHIGRPEDTALAVTMLLKNSYATGVLLDIDGGMR